MTLFIRKTEEKRLAEIELKRLPIDSLCFAPYQRELKPSKVKRIAENFNPDVVGIALVSFRNGKFWCLDGQHRVKAMKKLGYTEVWCQVITGLTYEEECKRFNILNTGRTQLTANQVFHCRVEEKEINAVDLVEIFNKYRFDYNKNASCRDDNVIGAVSKFVKIQRNHGNGMVERVVRVLRNAWLGDKNSLASAIITGLATFFSENPDVNEFVLTKALEKISPLALVLQANNYANLNVLRPGRADSTCYHIAKIISQCYEAELAKTTKEKNRKVEA